MYQKHLMIFQQKGIKINITEKGKPRPVSELLKDLSYQDQTSACEKEQNIAVH